MEFIEIYNPANPSQLVGKYPMTPSEAVPELMTKARAAQKVWAGKSQIERGRIVDAFLDGLSDRSEEIALSITLEMGKTIAEARGEVAKALSEGRFMLKRVGNPTGEVFPSGARGGSAYSIRRPRGVILGINPWNFPFSTPVRKTIPALLYGNAMVLKPSINTPGAAFIMQEVADKVLPEGLFQNACGARDCSVALTRHPYVNAISFTGSVAVGKLVASAAVENLAEISLELGGKNPVILNDAGNLDDVLDQIYSAAFAICGQRCTAISRVIVHRDLAAATIKGLADRAKAVAVGDGLADGTQMGPVSSQTQLDSVAGFVDRARAAGANVAAGGERIIRNTNGYFYAPTVLSDVTPDMEVAREEVFGPVLTVLAYETADEAIAIANDVAYGLSSCVYSEQAPLIERFIAESESGMIHVNSGSFPEEHIPFVGVKASSLGVGGSNGPSTLHFYTQEHAVYRRGQAS